MAGKAKFAWGITRSGEIRHIGGVPSGLACECLCLDCGIRLIAHKGEFKAAHFQHASATDCSGESVLHKAAKHMLANAAGNSSSLDAPESQGQLEREDFHERLHQRDWQVAAENRVLDTVSIEVSLSDQLIADAVASTDSSRALAVEIFVTNRKDDEAQVKYQTIDHDALEIDLSSLSWDIEPDALQREVLSNAPRRWLYRHEAVAAKNAVDAQLQADIRCINDNANARFDTAVAHIRDHDLLTARAFPWPTVVGVAFITRPPRMGSYREWKEPIRVGRKPRFTQLVHDWARTEACWSVSGKVEGRTHACIEFRPDTPSKVRRRRSCPTLVVPVDVERLTRNFVRALKPYWVGIEAWEARLREIAEKERDEKLAAECIEIERNRRWRLAFAQRAAQQQLEEVTQKWMKVECPPSAGPFAPAWNTTYHVWKSVIWQIHIRRLFTGQFDQIHVKTLAVSDYFGELLDWPDTEAALTQRSKNLWFWFKDLESLGILAHTGRQFFEADTRPPSNFRPWLPVKNPRRRG